MGKTATIFKASCEFFSQLAEVSANVLVRFVPASIILCSRFE